MAQAWVCVKTASEISLKSSFVRQSFMKTLEQNIKNSLRANSLAAGSFERKGGRIFFNVEKPEKALKVLKKVFGIHALAVCEKFQSAELPAIVQEVEKYSRKVLKKGNSFAVRAKLAAKKHFNSKAVEERCGTAVLKAVKGIKVNLSKPDVKITVEVFEDSFFVYSAQEKAFTGLPVGVSGTVAFFPSKEPAMDFKACWLLLKRGCNLILVGKPGKLAGKLKEWNTFQEPETVETAEKALKLGSVCFASGDLKLGEKSIKQFNAFDSRQNELVLRPLLLCPFEIFKKQDLSFEKRL